jgi:YafQ family addiction module toxin component
MYKISFSKTFAKQYSKLPSKMQKQTDTCLEKLMQDPFQPSLRNHQLKGEWSKYRSISAAGDLRLHYIVIDKEIRIEFVAVGSHSQLYK